MALTNDQLEFLLVQELVMSFGLDILLTGIYMCIVFFIIYFFCSNRRCRAQKSSKVLTAIILFMFLVRLIHVGSVWYQIWAAFVQHGDSRDSAIEAWEAIPDLVLSDITAILLTAIADSLMVWRCWIISNSNVKVTLLPFVLNLVAIVFGLLFVALDRATDTTPPLALLMSTLNMSFSVATTILSTLIIVIRILMVGKVPGDMRVRKHYSKPLAIIIESSALYTIAFIIDIPFVSILSDFATTTYLYVDSFAQNMAVIAPALLTLRVLMGKTLPEHSQHETRSKMTTLRFDHDDEGPSEQSSAVPPADSQVVGEDVVDIRQLERDEKEIV